MALAPFIHATFSASDGTNLADYAPPTGGPLLVVPSVLQEKGKINNERADGDQGGGAWLFDYQPSTGLDRRVRGIIKIKEPHEAYCSILGNFDLANGNGYEVQFNADHQRIYLFRWDGLSPTELGRCEWHVEEGNFHGDLILPVGGGLIVRWNGAEIISAPSENTYTSGREGFVVGTTSADACPWLDEVIGEYLT